MRAAGGRGLLCGQAFCSVPAAVVSDQLLVENDAAPPSSKPPRALPMTILDRYILRQFFLNFAMLFAVLFLFSCMADLFVNLDRFVNAARELERIERSEAAEQAAIEDNLAEPTAAGGSPATSLARAVPGAAESEAAATLPDLAPPEGAAPVSGDPATAITADESAANGVVGQFEHVQRVVWMVIDFYWPRLFQFYAFLFGVVVIGATGFTLTQFHRNRELTAVLAAGVSLHRVALPLIIAALGLNVLQFANRELMLPRLAPQLLRGHGDLGQRELAGFRAEMVRDGQGQVFHAREYRPDEQRMHNVTVWVVDRETFRLESRIRADSATWTGDGWALENGRVFQVGREIGRDLDRRGTVEFIASDLDPQTLLLRRYQQFRQMLSLRQIGELSERESMFSSSQRALFERVRYGRFAQFLVNMFAFLIALPFFLIREPRNLFVQAVGCASISLTAQIGGAIFTVVGMPGLPPAASVFLFPLLILLPLAAAFMGSVKT